MSVVPSHEDVGRSVIGNRRTGALETRWHSDQQIALILIQGVAHEPAALCPPDVTQFRVEIASDEFGDSILEPLLLLVGERKVVGIGTDSHRPACRGGASRTARIDHYAASH